MSRDGPGGLLKDMRTRLKGVGIALIICVLTFPLAVILTLLTVPVWRWFEEVTGIESAGHSGPAEWCYLAVYIGLMILATVVWQKLERRDKR